MKKRVNLMDWSGHVLTIEKNEFIERYTLKQPSAINCMVVFTNVSGVLLVTGDLGRWSFCREFSPSPDGAVSDEYWCEKLEIGSIQKSETFDSDVAREKCKERVSDLSSMGFDGYDFVVATEFFETLSQNCEDEHEYLSYARGNKPNCIDYEDVPDGKSMVYRLNYIFDAFDEICRRLKLEDDQTKNEKK